MRELEAQPISDFRRSRRDEVPRSVEHELQLKAKYPHELLLSGGDSKLTLRYRRSRKYAGFDGGITSRQLFAWIEDDQTRIGALEFDEWHLDCFTDGETFFDSLDGTSAADAALAEAVLSAWDIEELAPYGALVEFRLAWV